mmetsp:Transcript_4658/g.18604  ORF Transcript_4658/g.18604 Transcript_4658/m.18604 type:complete len:233 (-) Transcript_4658:94-792(-)
MVAIWDRSPHSARNVNVKLCAKIFDCSSSTDACTAAFFSFASSSGSRRDPSGPWSFLWISSSSTSRSSSEGPEESSRDSYRSRTPKYRNRIADAKCVYARGSSDGRVYPTIVLRTVIKARAERAPAKTSMRLCFIARTAAMKKVLSPNSVTMIIARLLTKAGTKPKPTTSGICSNTSSATSSWVSWPGTACGAASSVAKSGPSDFCAPKAKPSHSSHEICPLPSLSTIRKPV